jgi:hypothetical protein
MQDTRRTRANSLTGDVLVSFHRHGRGMTNMAKLKFSTVIVLSVFLTAAPEAAVYAQGDKPMTFSPGANTTNEFVKRTVIDHGVPRIYAVGLIEADSAAKLKAYVAQRRIKHAKLVFDSPGGSLIGGLRLTASSV